MSESVPRPIRKVGIADHLWDVFDQMAREMGSDREGLVNQALFMFARLNGFLGVAAAQPGQIRVSGGNGATRTPEPPEPVERTPLPAPMPEARRPTVSPGGRSPAREPLDPPMKARRAEAPPPPADFDVEPPSSQMDDDPARKAVAERVLQTAQELENLIKGKSKDEPAGGETGVTGAEGDKSLYLSVEGRELEKIAKDRYLIGRGKHCDLVINSGKVSREHAAIVRDGDDFYVQDLDSSNGTWFNKQRIKRRKIDDGDEYFICSDKIKFVYR